MADVFSLIASICDMSEKIYHFYQVTQKRDKDISELRIQLLGLQEKSVLIRVALQREGLRTEDQHKVKQALKRCDQEVKRLRVGLARFQPKSAIHGKALSRFKLWVKGTSQEAKWPFQRSTILAFLDDVRTCQSAVDESIKLLHLSVSARTVEELHALDDNVTNNTITVEGALRDLRSGIEAAYQQISEQLARQEQELSRQTEVITNRITDQELEKLLLDPDFQKRQKEIVESDDKTYDFFTKSAQDYPQAANLLKFLQTETGIFWISGEAASGKSTLMKHLSSPTRPNGRHLWVWEGDGEVTIARHFCWIAGSGDQKSQSALLRTFLYYIVREERPLAHLVSDHRPAKGEAYAAWRTADLWSCLSEAITASTRRICLFIDALDELEETSGFEGTHRDIVANLIRLSRLPNVKMIISSRPWKAFQILGTRGRTLLRMETVNRRAILDYWRSKLAHEKTFADVAWDCLYTTQRRCHHSYGDGNGFVSKLLEKSNGNFLWTTLVAKSLPEWLKGGKSVAQLTQDIEKTSGKLTDYLRDRVLMRVSDAWDCQKPLALKMSVFNSSWIPFWMLRNSELQQLSIADPNVPIALAEYTLQELRAMMRETIAFLQECCRDLLDLRLLVDCVESNDSNFTRRWWRAEVSFIHRSIFDFLRMPDAETQKLVFDNLPGFFNNESFKASLYIIRWVIRPAEVVGPRQIDWFRMEACYDSISCAIAAPGTQRLVSRDLASKAEKVFMHQTNTILGCDKHDPARQDFGPYTILFCYELAPYGLYTLTDTMLEKAPELICLKNESGSSMLELILTMFPNSVFTHFELLKKVLEAGADPNEHLESDKEGQSWSTPWCLFLEFLDLCATNALHSCEGSATSKSERLTIAQNYIASDISDVKTISPHVQTVL